MLMNKVLLPSAKHLEKRLLWFVRAPTPTLCYMAPHGFIRTPMSQKITQQRPRVTGGSSEASPKGIFNGLEESSMAKRNPKWGKGILKRFLNGLRESSMH